MSAREREHGELPSPNLSLFSRKVGQGHFAYEKRFNSRYWSKAKAKPLQIRRPRTPIFAA